MVALACGPLSSKGEADPETAWCWATPYCAAWAVLSGLELAHGLTLAVMGASDPFFLAFGMLLALGGAAGLSCGIRSLLYSLAVRASMVSVRTLEKVRPAPHPYLNVLMVLEYKNIYQLRLCAQSY